MMKTIVSEDMVDAVAAAEKNTEAEADREEGKEKKGTIEVHLEQDQIEDLTIVD